MQTDTPPPERQPHWKLKNFKGRQSPPFTRETRPIPPQQLPRAQQTECICGCGRPLHEATRVMVPTLGFACDHQHAGIACAKWWQSKKAKLEATTKRRR